MIVREKVELFLSKYNMNHNTLDLKKQTETFVSEMNKGLKGISQSLMMLPTYISINENVPVNEPIIVMDAGGTNFRLAVAYFNDKYEAVIENFSVYKMPGSESTITKQDFFGTIADWLMPIAHKSERIGFCFSYPCEILSNGDGKFIEFNKEVSVTGMEGTILGIEINKALAEKGIPPKKFTVLNDTVATMLGGIISHIDCVDGYIGEYMAVNMESGGYKKFPQGDIDKLLDFETNDPGEFIFEKMIGGAYLGTLMYKLVYQAAKDGLFTKEFSKYFESDNSAFPLWEVNEFLDSPKGDNTIANLVNNDSDRQILTLLFTSLYERSAKLVTIALGAVITKMGCGKNPQKPVCIVADGTTFKKSKVFLEKLDIYVKKYLNETLGVYCKFYTMENTTLLGTAVAALTQNK